MKIMHCVFEFSFMDDWGYQENILSEMHQKLGHEVCILTSTLSYRPGLKKHKYRAGKYILKNGVNIIRLSPFNIPFAINKKLKLLSGVQKEIEEFSPDLIFLHNGTSGSVFFLIGYLKKHSYVKLVVDSHADYVNSGKNWLSRILLHKGLYRYFYKQLLPYATFFYGTLPIRCDFLHKFYHIPNDKIKLLLMGFDDTNVPYNEAKIIRTKIRKKYNIEPNDFVIVTGGKIDIRKRIIELIKAIKNLPINNIKLLVFGEPTVDMIGIYKQESNSDKVRAIGWIPSSDIYQYYFSADLAVFPGTHSVLWEQAIACGLPAIFRRWEGITHIDLGGNCIFIDDCDEKTISTLLIELYNNPYKLEKMKEVAEKRGRKTFSYLEIAKSVIEDCF